MGNVLYDILIGVAIGLLVPLFVFVFRYLRRKFRGYSRCVFLHSAEEINEKISNLDFLRFERGKQLDGTLLHELYEKDMRSITIRDANNRRTIKIPYLEVINFIQHPDTKIHIEPLAITEEFDLSEQLNKATEPALNDVLTRKPHTTDDSHPRMASLEKVGENEYCCSFERTTYFKQIRTNLTMDYPIEVENEGETTNRHMEIRRMAQADNDASMKTADPGTHPYTLPSLSESGLANVVGVSAIWCMGQAGKRKYYLLPRKQNVGVYENRLGMPSGDIECPQNNVFPNDSLIDFLEWEIAREFAEETGIADIDKDFELYSKPIDEKKIYHRTKMKIIPLAFLREMLRGGKPQMFFLIRTEDIDEKTLQNSFKKSLGNLEFSNSYFTSAKLSTEVACNYLYAQAYLQHCDLDNDCVDVSRVRINE